MSTRNILKPIVGFLSVLGLDTERVPSVTELRSAYRALLHLHPDKAGKDSTAKFQEITEAAQAVLEFLTLNTNLQPEVVDDDDILGSLVKENNLMFNNGSTSLDLPMDGVVVDAWMHEFGVELGHSKPLPNSVSDIQFIKDSWSLKDDSSSSLTTFGKVSVIFYSTTGKVLIQGTSFMEFTTLVMPNMVLRMRDAKEPSPPPADTATPAVDVNEETEEFFDHIDSTVPNPNDENSTILLKGFKRMENAVVALCNDLIKKVDESITNADDKEKSKLDAISLKLESLENLLTENKTELVGVNDKLTEIAGKQTTVKLEQADIDVLATAVSGISSTKQVELDEIVSAIMEVKDKLDDNKMNDVMESNKKVIEKLDGVKDLSDTFTVGLKQLETIFDKEVFRNVATNSEQSVSALNSLNGHMVNLLTKFDGIIKPTPTSNTSENEANVETVINESIEKEGQRKIKKCIFFSSSVALGCNKKKLEYELDCQLEIVETYHIVENPTAPDPEKFLKNMLDTHMKVGEVDFIVISVGSNDITFLSNDKDSIKLSEEAICHSSKLAKIATEVAVKHGIDVFITVRPARYDKKEKDPKGVKTVVNESANGMLVALTSVIERVHTIKLPALENLPEKAKKSLYKNDGIHLTNAGLAVFEDSLVAGIRNIFTDMEPSKDRGNLHPASPQPRQGDREQDGRGGSRIGHPDHNDGRGGSRNGFGHPDHNDGRGSARGQRSHGVRQQQQYGRPPQHRYNNNNRNRDRQEHGMPDMVRDFMAFMNDGPGQRYRGRY